MNNWSYDMQNLDVAWCPGCGDFSILKILKEALAELEINPKELVICSGIGQAAKTPHYLKCNVYNGLHGRALPPATAIKAVNPQLTVIAISGDGDMYGEGGNHLISTMRRNPNITNIVNNNMVYGLTKGQASPTTQKGFLTAVQNQGVSAEPFNPITTAIAQDASFVARAFCGDIQQSKDILKKAILHKGYSLVDIFQPCVTFNKVNTFKWFKENTYYLEENYDYTNRVRAFEKAIETDKLPLGIFYVNENKTIFEETAANKDITCLNPLSRRKNRSENLKKLIKSYQFV
jgi:2-oxoglutarate ferredoxin oxidoreductase subunit beta